MLALCTDPGKAEPAKCSVSHGQVVAQPLGVVRVLVSSQPTEDRLAQQADKGMPSIPALTRIGEHAPGHGAETEGIVEFAVRQQSGIGGDAGPMELQLQAAVETEPEGAVACFTRRVRHLGLT